MNPRTIVPQGSVHTAKREHADRVRAGAALRKKAVEAPSLQYKYNKLRRDALETLWLKGDSADGNTMRCGRLSLIDNMQWPQDVHALF